MRDAARAYVALLGADERAVSGQIFNVIFGNFRVSEMALRIREALATIGTSVGLRGEYMQRRVRSYRVSARKVEQVFGFKPIVSIEDSVKAAVVQIQQRGSAELGHSRYYNIRWFKALEEAHALAGAGGSVFSC